MAEKPKIYAPPMVVTVAIIHEKSNKNQILLSKRAREPFKGMWSLIGGTGALEDTSYDPKIAVVSEVEADLSLPLEEPKFLHYFASNPNNKPVIALVFTGYVQGTPTLNPAYAADYKWADLDQILQEPEKQLAFNGIPMLRYYKQTLC